MDEKRERGGGGGNGKSGKVLRSAHEQLNASPLLKATDGNWLHDGLTKVDRFLKRNESKIAFGGRLFLDISKLFTQMANKFLSL